MPEDKQMLSTIYIDKKLGELIYAVLQVNEMRPDWYGRVSMILMRGLETGLVAHRKGGVESSQIKGLEKMIQEVDLIKAGKK